MNGTLTDPTLVFLAYIEYKGDAVRRGQQVLSFVEFRLRVVEALTNLWKTDNNWGFHEQHSDRPHLGLSGIHRLQERRHPVRTSAHLVVR